MKSDPDHSEMFDICQSAVDIRLCQFKSRRNDLPVGIPFKSRRGRAMKISALDTPHRKCLMPFTDGRARTTGDVAIATPFRAEAAEAYLGGLRAKGFLVSQQTSGRDAYTIWEASDAFKEMIEAAKGEALE